MDVTSTAKYIRVSPRKLRLVSKSINHMQAHAAIEALMFISKKAALPLQTTIKTAISDAVTTYKLEKNRLWIKAIDIGEGPKLKRWQPVARGSAHPYVRRMSQIKVILEEKEDDNVQNKTAVKKIRKQKQEFSKNPKSQIPNPK